MKNLKKWRKREIGYTVLCVILLFMPIVLLTLLNTLFSGLLNQNNTTMVAIICMMVFWGVVLFLLKKHTHNMLIVDAMVKNEKRLRSDRRFYPSNRRDVTKDFLYGILAAEGFVLGEKAPCLAVKGNTGVWISDETLISNSFCLKGKRKQTRKPDTEEKTDFLIAYVFCATALERKRRIFQGMLLNLKADALSLFFMINAKMLPAIWADIQADLRMRHLYKK